MTLYPDVYRTAQSEIDRVVGPDRLPNFQDREYLPYLDSVFKEIFRCVIVIFNSWISLLTHVSWTAGMPLYLWVGDSFFPNIRRTDQKTGLPHSVMEDDLYRDYFLPKGAIVIPNIWYVLVPTKASVLD
jgi:hypothetical protein